MDRLSSKLLYTHFLSKIKKSATLEATISKKFEKQYSSGLEFIWWLDMPQLTPIPECFTLNARIKFYI